MRDVGHLDQVVGEQNGQFGGVFVDLRNQDAVGVFNIGRAQEANAVIADLERFDFLHLFQALIA